MSAFERLSGTGDLDLFPGCNRWPRCVGRRRMAPTNKDPGTVPDTPGATLNRFRSAARTLSCAIADPRQGFAEKLFAEHRDALQRCFYRRIVQRITAGYQACITPGAAFAEKVAVDVNQTLSWLQHKIVFDHRPLGEVAAEFNRYASIPVEIEGEELRALPVSGMFDAGDTDATLQAMPAEVQRDRHVGHVHFL